MARSYKKLRNRCQSSSKRKTRKARKVSSYKTSQKKVSKRKHIGGGKKMSNKMSKRINKRKRHSKRRNLKQSGGQDEDDVKKAKADADFTRIMKGDPSWSEKSEGLNLDYDYIKPLIENTTELENNTKPIFNFLQYTIFKEGGDPESQKLCISWMGCLTSDQFEELIKLLIEKTRKNINEIVDENKYTMLMKLCSRKLGGPRSMWALMYKSKIKILIKLKAFTNILMEYNDGKDKIDALYIYLNSVDIEYEYDAEIVKMLLDKEHTNLSDEYLKEYNKLRNKLRNKYYDAISWKNKNCKRCPSEIYTNIKEIKDLIYFQLERNKRFRN